MELGVWKKYQDMGQAVSKHIPKKAGNCWIFKAELWPGYYNDGNMKDNDKYVMHKGVCTEATEAHFY